MKKVIFDCDNTMGIAKRDVDDGLTLMYLLGNPHVDLIGITTTYGNSNIEDVYSNTETMLSDLDMIDIPLLKGASSNDYRQSEASKFLLQSARKNKGQLHIIATGSLTNLLGAYELDNNFFDYLKSLVVMGGITSPLLINGKSMDELNFSCDPLAAYTLFYKCKNLTIISAQLCLQALFGSEEYSRLMDSPTIASYRYIKEKTEPWFEYIGGKYNTDGFYNWDIVAGVFLTNPELFDKNICTVNSSLEDLKCGKIRTTNSSLASINIPHTILDKDSFTDIIFDSWASVSVEY